MTDLNNPVEITRLVAIVVKFSFAVVSVFFNKNIKIYQTLRKRSFDKSCDQNNMLRQGGPSSFIIRDIFEII